jgi:hypothetical protein
MVMELYTSHEVCFGGAIKAKLDLSWADDMIGVIPVFRTKKAALKFAGKSRQVVSIEEVPDGKVQS